MLDQLNKLPDSHTPQVLYDRLVERDGSIAKLLERDKGLFLDVLALAAWSPWLATTLEQNPDYLSWLQRERLDTRVRSREDIGESLARFALTHSQLDPHDMFARFRRRELLRIYLHESAARTPSPRQPRSCRILPTQFLNTRFVYRGNVWTTDLDHRNESIRRAALSPLSFASSRSESWDRGNSIMLRTSI